METSIDKKTVKAIGVLLKLDREWDRFCSKIEKAGIDISWPENGYFDLALDWLDVPRDAENATVSHRDHHYDAWSTAKNAKQFIDAVHNYDYSL